ncbi:PAS domain S-box protein [Arcticibacter sp. MXS-1]|uniref:PAS domain S-box protein n=1 Tax=Arcticibacter sp. MXS-1 TaxID=3341726 RepID=UPI0035A9AB0F
MFDLFSKGLASPVVLLGGTELKIKYANEAARKVLGLPSDLQDACLDRFLGDQNPSLLQSVQGVFESGLPANRHDEKLSLRRDGETVELFISYSCTPLSRAEGREALLVISIEQKKQETGGENSVLAFLNEDDCVFRRLCYFELNLKTRLVRTVQKEIGKAPVSNTFSLAEFLNKVVPEHRSFVEEQFSRGIEQGILDLVCPVRQSDGSVHSIKVSGFSRSAELAGPPVFDGVFADVTAEKEVEEKQARLAAIVENTDDTILSKTLDGIITSWNPAAEKMFGYSEQEAVGKHISLIIHPERLHEEDDIISSIRSGKKVDHFETVRMTKDGQRIPISLTVSPIRDAEGRVVGASKIARNITLQKEAEEAAKRYTKSLEIINSMIRTVSDELNLKNILQKVSDATTQLTGAQFGAFFYHATRREDESFQLYTVSGVTPERFKNLGPVRHTPLFHTTFTGTGVERLMISPRTRDTDKTRLTTECRRAISQL